MNTVRMQHPGLPGEDIEVPASAVPHHAAAGWEVIDEPLPPGGLKPVPADPGAAAGTDPQAAESAPLMTAQAPKRRRAAKEGDS